MTMCDTDCSYSFAVQAFVRTLAGPDLQPRTSDACPTALNLFARIALFERSQAFFHFRQHG